MNPFLAKPLKKVQPGENLRNSSQEHRPSKYLNPNISKNPKITKLEKRTVEGQKERNPSPKENNIKPINNIQLTNKNNPPKEENIIQTNSVEKSVPTEKVKNTENNSKKISSDLKIEKSIKFTLQKIKSDKLVFQNNDEIIEYLKNQIKDGKIKNIFQKLEIKKSEFTGFTLSKKNQGYTIYEIEIEEDIEKVNELLKKQKVEIKNKPIELKYTQSESVSTTNTTFKKENEIKEKKNFTENKKPENLLQAMKNKTLEKQSENLKKDSNELKTLQNKVQKRKEELRNAENEKDFIRKEQQNKNNAIKNSNKYSIQAGDNDIKSKRRESGIKIKTVETGPVNTMPNANEKPEKKKITAEENQRRASRALARFKKAFSNKKDEDKGPESSNKIQSLAAILKEHIIKPLAEIQEENEGRAVRAGSVECRSIKPATGMAEILENAPVQKKNVKKPKNINFGE